MLRPRPQNGISCCRRSSRNTTPHPRFTRSPTSESPTYVRCAALAPSPSCGILYLHESLPPCSRLPTFAVRSAGMQTVLPVVPLPTLLSSITELWIDGVVSDDGILYPACSVLSRSSLLSSHRLRSLAQGYIVSPGRRS